MKISLLLLSLVVFTAGCTKKSSGDYNLNISETIRTNLSAEPPSLDWHKSSDTTSSEVTGNVMDGLTQYNLKDPNLSLLPALAEKWTSSKDQKTWTFVLRKDVKWTDGVPFTAQNMIDAWERLLNKDTGALYAYFLFNVKNAKKYNAGEIKDFAQVGVKANAAGDLVVELEKPQSYFPMLLTHHSTFPIRKDVIEKGGENWTRPEHIQTLGAYKLNIWDNDKALVLERNENYYGDKAKTKFVLMRIVKETSTALKMFEKGQIDSMNEVPSLEIARLKEKPQFRLSPSLGIYYFGFNVKKKPFDNVDVRKAINMAIDREEIVKLLNGGQKGINGWLPVGMFGFNGDVGIKFNREAAAKLLDKAGYADRTKFPKITIGFNTNENHQRVTENIQAQLKRNLGIDVELQNWEWKSYNGVLQADAPQMYRMAWIADFPDPDNFFGLITSDSENNHTNWSNPKFDELVKKGVSVGNPVERKKIYDEAQKILTETDVPVVPIYSYVNHQMVSDRIENFPSNAMQKFEYKDVVIK
ncbi:MAG: peptide ABC transporter substrate-binding protein [Bdellovibrionota bacterium]